MHFDRLRVNMLVECACDSMSLFGSVNPALDAMRGCIGRTYALLLGGELVCNATTMNRQVTQH
jgi:hypothetical protein